MPDVSNTTSNWIDLYAASGITPGTKILVQNKSNGYALVLEAASAPSNSDTSGRIVNFANEIEIDAGSPGVWYRCFGGIAAFVQVR